MPEVPIQTATPVDPQPNNGCRVFIRTAGLVFVLVNVWIWAILECIPVEINRSFVECDPIPVPGRMFLSVLAIPLALVIATVPFVVVRRLSGWKTPS